MCAHEREPRLSLRGCQGLTPLSSLFLSQFFERSYNYMNSLPMSLCLQQRSGPYQDLSQESCWYAGIIVVLFQKSDTRS